MKKFILIFIALILLSGCAVTKFSVTGGDWQKKTVDTKISFVLNKKHKAIPIISIGQETGLDLHVRPTSFQVEWKFEEIW